MIQGEPADPEILGQLAAVGIVKGKPFTPDARMKKILTDAVAVGNATARAISFQPRDDAFYFYPGESAWFTPFVGGSSEFIQNNVRLLDARICFFYLATGITLAFTYVSQNSGYLDHRREADRRIGGHHGTTIRRISVDKLASPRLTRVLFRA